MWTTSTTNEMNFYLKQYNFGVTLFLVDEIKNQGTS